MPLTTIQRTILNDIRKDIRREEIAFDRPRQAGKTTYENLAIGAGGSRREDHLSQSRQ